MSKEELPVNKLSFVRRMLLSIGLPLWLLVGFILSQVLVVLLIQALDKIGVPMDRINASLLQLVGGAVIYGLSLLIVIGIPRLFKRKTTKEELGIQRPPRWSDLIWVPAGAFIYLILTSLITTVAMSVLTFINYDQAQDTGFANMSTQFEYVLAFIMLVIIAPVAEELLFRGYLFGKLRQYAPLWIAILITSLVFAVVHFAWNVGLDVFALSIVLCWLRVQTGSLWPSIMLHMLKNTVAFYLLFILPLVS